LLSARGLKLSREQFELFFFLFAMLLKSFFTNAASKDKEEELNA